MAWGSWRSTVGRRDQSRGRCAEVSRYVPICAFCYYRQPPRYRFDAVPLLLLYAGCVGDGVRELEADSGLL